MRYLPLVAVLVFLLGAHPAKAVPPPDFIFNVSAQIVQFFSMAVVVLSALTGSIFQFFRQKFTGPRKTLFLIVGLLVSVLFAGGGAWWYGKYAERRALREWIAESQRYADGLADAASSENGNAFSSVSGDDLDQLSFEGTAPSSSTEPRISDAVTAFIHRYYDAIAAGDVAEAYRLSRQNVSFQTFRGWYASTTGITIDRLQRIDAKKTSLELTLAEGEHVTRYGVLMDVRLNESGEPVQVESSQVRVLSESAGPSVQMPASTGSSDDRQAHVSESISNVEFGTTIHEPGASFVVLDARERIEFENGHFPDAVHIRFADLKAGRWIELPTDRPVYVFCWSGIRGKEVTEFLRSKNIFARYLENGAAGWVADGGAWIGEISFLHVYTEDRYTRVFTAEEVSGYMSQGVTLVDTRSPNAYAAWHLPGSVNIPLMSTPTISLESAFAQVPPHATVITVCDGYVNCFDAKLTGVELERRGHAFFGRFAEPWRLKTDR